MRTRLSKLGVVALAMAFAAPMAIGGRVFLTGHDPDFHAQEGVGAKNLLRAGLSFVTNETYDLGNGPKFLWVESRITPPTGHLVGENGLIEIGLSLGIHYDRANAAELSAVDFEDYTAVVIASSFGGLLTRAELDALIARVDDIKAFINGGGGLMALAECLPCGANLLAGPTPPDLFGFLPVEVSSISTDPPFTVTAFGAAPPFNLQNSDLNDPTHNSFGLIGGLTPVDLDQSGQATTLAGAVVVGSTGLSQLLLEPASAEGPVGTSHALTAHAFDSLEDPVAGVDVTFLVVSGPNVGDTGQDTTDSGGNAHFAFVGDGGPGIDVIEASALDSQGEPQTSNPASMEWDIESVVIVDNGCPGSMGAPQLSVDGTYQAGSATELHLIQLVPSSVSVLMVGFEPALLVREGCTLLFHPVLKALLFANASGEFHSLSHWPPGIPSGQMIFLQAYQLDGGAPTGFSSSNTVKITVP